MDAAEICVPQNILKAIFDDHVTILPKDQLQKAI